MHFVNIGLIFLASKVCVHRLKIHVLNVPYKIRTDVKFFFPLMSAYTHTHTHTHIHREREREKKKVNEQKREKFMLAACFTTPLPYHTHTEQQRTDS